MTKKKNISEDEYLKKYKIKKGYRVTNWVLDQKQIMHCLDNLKGIETKFKTKKDRDGQTICALYRYS
jgi:hypothetical protein